MHEPHRTGAAADGRAAIRSAGPFPESVRSPTRDIASTSGRLAARHNSRPCRNPTRPIAAGSNAMQPRQRRIHVVIDRRALGRIRARHLRLPEHAAVDEIHHIERRAGDGLVAAIENRLRDRKALRMQRADDAEFAIDRMRGGQQLPRRLAAQHIFRRGRFQQIGRVGLPALELLDRRPGRRSRAPWRRDSPASCAASMASAPATSLVPENACWRSIMAPTLSLQPARSRLVRIERRASCLHATRRKPSAFVEAMRVGRAPCRS